MKRLYNLTVKILKSYSSFSSYIFDIYKGQVIVIKYIIWTPINDFFNEGLEDAVY